MKKMCKNLLLVIFILSSCILASWLGTLYQRESRLPEWNASPLDYLPGQDTWQVLRVVDGDSILVRYRGKMQAVQLLYLNAPEKGRPHFEQSRQGLLDLIEGERVKIEFRIEKEERDFFGRLLAFVKVNGINVNLEMVRNGFASVYEPDDSTAARELLSAESDAKAAGYGLWANDGDRPS